MSSNLPLEILIAGTGSRISEEFNAPAIAVTCSALRTCYRDELRRLSHLFDFPVTVTFILLSMKDREQLKERSTIRAANEQHYMKSRMVDSQLDLLEAPTDESDVTIVDSSQPKEKMPDDVFAIIDGIYT
ncbi:NRPS-like enzyme [Penicillium malachiteum]|uniref:gluconokinase n=1 Tax=Penicillium malachiteum TaxID=1324776 RepID=A0AAD6HJP8_9EURO|nr:NRPS-like enzyme [Penicillium malachiteum]